MNTFKFSRCLILYIALLYSRSFVNSMDNGSDSDLGSDQMEGAVSPFDFKIITAREDDFNIHKLNDVYDYELFKFPNSYAYLYVFKDGVRCVEFQYKDKTVWKKDLEENDNEFPKSIYFKNVAKEAVVYFNDAVSHLYQMVGDQFVYKEERSKNLTVSLKPGDLVVELDVDRKQNTENFQYLDNGNAETYSAWAGVKFQSIVKGDVELWRAPANKYAYKLDMCRTKNGKIAMVVYLDGNERMLAMKRDPDAPIEESEESDDEKNNEFESRMSLCGYEIVTADDPYGINYRINCKKDVTASTCTDGSLFLHFKKRLGFVELKYQGKGIWNNVSFMGDSYLASLHFIPQDKKIVAWVNKKAPVVYNLTYWNKEEEKN